MLDWGQWANEPLLVGLLVVMGWLYGMAVGPWRPRLAPGAPLARRRAGFFFAGLAVAYLTVGAPWERIGRYYLFSVQLSEQLLLVYAAAALLLAGLTDWMADAVLRAPGLGAIVRVLTRPLVAGGVFIIILSASYLPRIHERVLHSGRGMELEHLLFLVVGMWFWWPLLSPSRVKPPLKFGGRLVYLFVVEVALSGAFTYLLMAEHAIYPTYALAPRLIPGISPEEDQILGGILLSAVSSAVLVGALGYAFFTWAREEAAGHAPGKGRK